MNELDDHIPSVLKVSYIILYTKLFPIINYLPTASLAGESVIIIEVIVFPQSESCRILVNFESLKNEKFY